MSKMSKLIEFITDLTPMTAAKRMLTHKRKVGKI